LISAVHNSVEPPDRADQPAGPCPDTAGESPWRCRARPAARPPNALSRPNFPGQTYACHPECAAL